MNQSTQFNVQLKCVEKRSGIPWVGTKRFEVSVTPVGRKESRIVGQGNLTSNPPFSLVEYLLDFTTLAGNRRLHSGVSPNRAYRIVAAAYNPASRHPYHPPADELAIRCFGASEAEGAEITVGGERVGRIVKVDHPDAAFKASFDSPTPYGVGCDASSFEEVAKRVREMVWPRPQGFETLQRIYERHQRGDSYALFRAPERYENRWPETDEEVRIGSASAAAPISDALLVSFIEPTGRESYFRAKDTEVAVRFISERYNPGYHDGDTDKLVERDGVWEIERGSITIVDVCDGPLAICRGEQDVGALLYSHDGRTMTVMLDCEYGAKHTVHSWGQARRVTAERLELAAKSGRWSPTQESPTEYE